MPLHGNHWMVAVDPALTNIVRRVRMGVREDGQPFLGT